MTLIWGMSMKDGSMFKLIELLYGMEGLEAVVSAQTLSFYHGRHS